MSMCRVFSLPLLVVTLLTLPKASPFDSSAASDVNQPLESNSVIMHAQLQTNFQRNEQADVINPNKTDINSICESFAAVFAEAASDYTRCFIVNARPLSLCTKCVRQYLVVNRAYADLEKTTDHMTMGGRDKIKNCRDWILNADRVMAIQQTKTFFTKLWTKSECSNCFSSTKWTPNITYCGAEYVEKFFNLSQTTLSCFKNFTRDLLLSNTSDPTTKACDVCQSVYSKQNTYYMKLNTEYGNKLCMDIVDSMNYTRQIWGNDFNCTGNTPQDGITITVTILFLVLPGVFYIATYIHYQRIEKKIITQNRMQRHRYASVRSTDMQDSVDFGASTSNSNRLSL